MKAQILACMGPINMKALGRMGCLSSRPVQNVCLWVKSSKGLMMGACNTVCTKPISHVYENIVCRPSWYDCHHQTANRQQTWRKLLCLVIFLVLMVPIVYFESEVRLGLRKIGLPVALDGYDQFYVPYPHRYRFTINESEKCKQQKPFLALLVPVATQDTKARDTIRSTWGSEKLIQGKVVTLFFLLGLPTGKDTEQIQEQVLTESRDHHDVLQGDFLDCYKNLTIKTMLMMEWLDAHCSSASYAMKIDSDMFLNAHKLVQMLLDAPKVNYMTGLVAHGAAVLRDPRSKWYLPAEVFPEPQYPRYALGLGYVFSLDLPRKLVEASRHVRAVYIEDVYVGLCMRYQGILPTDPPELDQFSVSPVPYSRCAYSKLIATTTKPGTDHVSVWNDFKRPGPFCE